MKNLNKFICTLLSVLLILTLFTGCSSNNQEDTPPDIPSGQEGSGETPPDMPDGPGGPGGTPPDKPNGQGGPGGMPPGGHSSSDISYTASVTISSSASESGKTYSSVTADESALMISTAEEVTITDPTVTKAGDSDGGDNCNFYGLNAAVLVKDGSNNYNRWKHFLICGWC